MLPIRPDAPWLAPLAGYSDLPFRLLCREQGAACACTEMVSAKGMVYGSKGTSTLLDTCARDEPLAVQLFGGEESFMRRATGMLVEDGFAYIDINAGCPVPKVVKTGSGAGHLRNKTSRANLVQICKSVVAVAGEGRVGVKFRLGWDMGDDIYLDLAKALEDAGAAWLTLHPRYGRQGYAGTAKWDALSELKKAVSVPLLASGDLYTARDAVRCIEETGVDGIMFARGALRDPGVFRDYADLVQGREPEPRDMPRVVRLVRRHIDLAEEHGNPYTAVFKMRTFIPRYIKDLPDASALRKRMVSCKTWDECNAILDVLESGEYAPEGTGRETLPGQGGGVAGQTDGM